VERARASTLPFTVTVHNDERELSDFYFDYGVSTDPFNGWITGPLVVVAIVFGLLRLWPFAAVLVLVALFLASPPGRRWFAKERARRTSRKVSPFTVTFSREGIQTVSDGARSETEWSRVSKIIVGHDCIIFRYRPAGTMYVPRAGLSVDQVKDLEACASPAAV